MRTGFATVLDHRDKLPFTVHCAILFQASFAAKKSTIHRSRPEQLGLGGRIGFRQSRATL
jgi:hypothetical protein